MTEMTNLAIGLLGPLLVQQDGTPVQIRGVRERTLLAALALRASRAVQTDKLVDALWDPDHLPVNATNSLQAAVSPTASATQRPAPQPHSDERCRIRVNGGARACGRLPFRASCE